jgi:hypothetical protein
MNKYFADLSHRIRLKRFLKKINVTIDVTEPSFIENLLDRFNLSVNENGEHVLLDRETS